MNFNSSLPTYQGTRKSKTHTFVSNWQLPIMNQWEGEIMALEIISWLVSKKVMWLGWDTNNCSQTHCRLHKWARHLSMLLSTSPYTDFCRCKFKGFHKAGCKSSENSGFGAKIRGVNSVSGEKLHDFEIICPTRGVHLHPSLHPCVWAWSTSMNIWHLRLFFNYLLALKGIPFEIQYFSSSIK